MKNFNVFLLMTCIIGVLLVIAIGYGLYFTVSRGLYELMIIWMVIVIPLSIFFIYCIYTIGENRERIKELEKNLSKNSSEQKEDK